MIKQQQIKTEFDNKYIVNPNVVLISVRNNESFRGELDFLSIIKNIKHIIIKEIPYISFDLQNQCSL